MPKNTQGGKKYKQQKHKNNNNAQPSALQKPTEGQSYSTVTKLLGNSRVTGRFYDTRDPQDKRMNEITCFLRPGLKKKRQFAKMGSIMIISLRDFEKDKADVVYIYSDDDTKRLKRKGLLHDDLIPKDEGSDECRFEEEDNGEDTEEENEVEQKPVEYRGKNISYQDFGLPPVSFDDEEEEDEENIENI